MEHNEIIIKDVLKEISGLDFILSDNRRALIYTCGDDNNKIKFIVVSDFLFNIGEPLDIRLKNKLKNHVFEAGKIYQLDRVCIKEIIE